MRPPFIINGERIAPGTRATISLPVSMLSNHSPVTLPVHVAHGRKEGPVLFVSAAVHGDEIIGVEVVRRLLKTPALKRLRGTLVCVPIVNAFGFINRSRYLPDRRDLNRTFPGGPKGSLANQLAHLFMTEIVKRSDFGIDIHSASEHRFNLPQVRVSEADDRLRGLASAFGAPVSLVSPVREGSLRAAAQHEGVGVLVFEAGEALRFDEFSARVGVKGVLRVMKHLAMVGPSTVRDSKVETHFATSSHWLRAPAGGLFRAFRASGESVREGDVVGVVADPLGDREQDVVVKTGGLIIGRANLPVVNQGDALFHIAHTSRPRAAEQKVGLVEKELEVDPLFDEDEII